MHPKGSWKKVIIVMLISLITSSCCLYKCNRIEVLGSMIMLYILTDLDAL